MYSQCFFFVKNTKTGKKGENRKQQQNVYRKNCFCKQLSQEFSLQANVISFYFFEKNQITSYFDFI